MTHELNFDSLSIFGEEGEGCQFCGDSLDSPHHPECAYDCAHNPDKGDPGYIVA
jgi:hypothetical protein